MYLLFQMKNVEKFGVQEYIQKFICVLLVGTKIHVMVTLVAL